MKPDNLKICPPTWRNLARLVAVNTEGEPSYRRTSKKELTERIADKSIFCAELDKEIVGLIYWRRDFLGRTNQWYLKQITVAKKFRSRGIGSKLLQYFLEYAKKNQIEKVFGDIHNDNHQSLLMNLKSGAIVSGYIHGVSRHKDDGRVIIRWDLNYEQRN